MTGSLPVPIPDLEAVTLLGTRIGCGGSRECFEVIGHPNAVIKVAKKLPLTNFCEWFVWARIKDTRWQKAFGACLTISESGQFLIMEKLTNLPDDAKTKTPTLPSFVRDVWWTNFGVNAEGHIKIRDYAITDMTDLFEADPGERKVWQGREH